LAQTALDFFTRLSTPMLKLMPCLPLLGAGDAVELYGESITGKTALTVECLAHCVLPAEIGCVHVGGCGEQAILIDTEGGFDVVRFGAVLRATLGNTLQAKRGHFVDEWAPAGLIAEEVGASLRRLSLMRCLSHAELLLGLASLGACARFAALAAPAVPAAAAAATAPADAVAPPTPPPMPRLLLIDSISSFQWLVRTDLAGARAHEACLLESLLRGLCHTAVVWTRSPDVAHQNGYEFPIVPRPLAVGSAPGALAPLRRLRLRRRLALARDGASPPDGEPATPITCRQCT
jgi:hypothetical protein